MPGVHVMPRPRLIQPIGSWARLACRRCELVMPASNLLASGNFCLPCAEVVDREFREVLREGGFVGSRTCCVICEHPYAQRHRLVAGCAGGRYERVNVRWLCPNHHAAVHFLMKWRIDEGKERVSRNVQRRLDGYMEDKELVEFVRKCVAPAIQQGWGSLYRKMILNRKKWRSGARSYRRFRQLESRYFRSGRWLFGVGFVQEWNKAKRKGAAL